MHPKDAPDVVGLKDPALAQVFGPAGGLLRRLEEEEDVVRQGGLLRQPLGQVQDHGHVGVVAAGVHLPGVAGGEGQAGVLLDGQGVGVAAKGDGLGPAEVEKGAQSPRNGGGQGAPQGGEYLAEIGQGLRQVPVQFRDLVEGPAVLDDLHTSSHLLAEKRKKCYTASVKF